MLFHPVDGRVRDQVGPPVAVHGVIVVDLIRGGDVVIVVGAETPVKSELTVKNEGGYEGAGPITFGRESLGQGRYIVREAAGAVHPAAVFGRVEAGQYRGVSGECEGNIAEKTIEKNAVSGQGIKRRRLSVRITVAAQPVGTGGVHGDQQEVISRTSILFGV